MEKAVKFNYCVGHYWNDENGEVGLYTYGNDHFYGTMKDAKEFMKYVKTKSPDRDWRIFQITEVPQ